MVAFRAPGEPILLRETCAGRVWAARPARVVRDGPDLTVTYFQPGTRWKQPADTGGRPLRLLQDQWQLADAVWRGTSALRLFAPGSWHSLICHWDEASWEFRGWYVNLETPMRRTTLGFDYLDRVLDIVIEPDRRWRWKDEDELAEAIARGLITTAEAQALRLDGEEVLCSLAAWESPFRDGWEDWRPDPAWTPPTLPAGWDRVPEGG